MSKKKIVIVGGGAAGFFSAINAAEKNPNLDVLLLERGKELLQKVKISGGGRCNVTHACFIPKDLVKFYPRGEKALLGPFNRFACGDTIEWFEKRGVKLKIEEDGRMFPESDSSQSIMDCLMDAARKAGVKIQTQARVSAISKETDGRFIVEVSGQAPILADALVLAAGSSTAVWALLETLSHTIVEPVPSLFTFNIKDARITDLLGISVSNATVEVIGEKKLNASGPLLITHWGMSGPGILRLSAWGARWMHEKAYHFTIRINWVADYGRMDDVLEILQDYKNNNPKRQLASNHLLGIPARLWKRFCAAAGISDEDTWANCSKKQLQALLTQLCQSEWQVKGKSTFKEEFVTAGGVELNEINFTRFESKLHPNLFIAGELLNIDAITGGFNFQAAWTGGWIISEALVDI